MKTAKELTDKQKDRFREIFIDTIDIENYDVESDVNESPCPWACPWLFGSAVYLIDGTIEEKVAFYIYGIREELTKICKEELQNTIDNQDDQ